MGAVFGITLLSAVAFQNKKVEPVSKPTEKVKIASKDPVKLEVVPLDSLLPDSTRAKQKRVQFYADKLDAITEKAATRNKIDEKQNSELAKQTEKVGKLVQESPFVQPLPLKDTGSVKGLDSSIIKVPEKKRGFFKKLFKRK